MTPYKFLGFAQNTVFHNELAPQFKQYINSWNAERTSLVEDQPKQSVKTEGSGRVKAVI